MIGFGVCVGPTDLFEQVSGPSIRRFNAEGAPVLTVTGQSSMFRAYNALLDQAQSAGCSGLLMIHDDVELRADPRPALEPLLEDDSVGVVGALGGMRPTSLAWWSQREGRKGRLEDWGKVHDYSSGVFDVDVVDDVIMCVSPWTIKNIRFPESRYGGFEGLGVILSSIIRRQSRRVLVADFDAMHHNTGKGFNGIVDWRRNELRWHREFFELTRAETTAAVVEDRLLFTLRMRMGTKRLVRQLRRLPAHQPGGESGEPVLDAYVERWTARTSTLRGRSRAWSGT